MDLQSNNDARGWALAIMSSLACLAGSALIYIDVLIRMIPSKRNFHIENSNVFLSASLSLSFGVMLFSALYSMLPSSRRYLIKGDFTKSQASWILLGGFVAGFVGIQILSRTLHRFMPSHVEDCDHTHDEVDHKEAGRSRASSREVSQQSHHHHHDEANTQSRRAATKQLDENTPLLFPAGAGSVRPGRLERTTTSVSMATDRRPSMTQVKTGLVAFVKDQKADCNEGDACFGYSDPCNRGCTRSASVSWKTMTPRMPSVRSADGSLVEESTPNSSSTRPSSLVSQTSGTDHHHHQDVESQHHHHVVENPFLSIGLQTSVAIAVHKLPEGFLTYATNHANPVLGFSVFMALFVHNISEGFSLALPLYLALGSRLRAFTWAAVLGGLSQPIGAGLAALWFAIAGNVQGQDPGSAVYGTMFAITAGIMASVALSLFTEALTLCHNKNLCVGFAFIGMILMGTSNALTAK